MIFVSDCCETPGHSSSKTSLIFFECDPGAAEYQAELPRETYGRKLLVNSKWKENKPVSLGL